ncbi:HlyD family efflux transporter periplasmic adaptor subunit [Vibrio cholerae]|nr:HlyD family efflux transporter periplasmic adaptor subunit [Vibrio cholerae]
MKTLKTKAKLALALALGISLMTTLKFEVVSPGMGVIVGGTGDIDIITPDSGFIDLVNVSVGDKLKKDDVLFSYNNLENYHRINSLNNIVGFLRARKQGLEQDVEDLSYIYGISKELGSTDLNLEDRQEDNGSNYIVYKRELESLVRKSQEFSVSESMNLAEKNELIKQVELLGDKLKLLAKSGSPKVELIDNEREVSQLNSSIVKLDSELLETKLSLKNQIDTFQIGVLEKISQLSTEISQISRELIESEDALTLTQGKQKANIIIAPIGGTILSIDQQFTVGSYIESSQKVMTIKQDQLNSNVEAKFESQYRPFLNIGLPVKVVVNSPGYKKTVNGIIKSISVDSFLDETNPSSNSRFYKVEISPDANDSFSAEMIGIQVNTYVLSDKITVFDYITATIFENVQFNVW